MLRPPEPSTAAPKSGGLVKLVALMLGPIDSAETMIRFVVSITAETVAGQHTAAEAVSCTSSTRLPYIVLLAPVGPLALMGTMDKRVTVWPAGTVYVLAEANASARAI